MKALHNRGPRMLILGSCVSRDVLNFAENASFSLADYYARSSIASLGTAPFQMDETCMGRITSDFQRRMVQRDLGKSFLQNIAAHRDIDLIVIDLIDERFDLFEMANDSVATISSEFLLTRFVTARDRSSSRWIPSGSARHRGLWKAGLKKLFTVLAAHGLADRVVVNKVFWADQMDDGQPLPDLEQDKHLAANALLAWMYRELEKHVPAERWLNFSREVLRVNPQHRWGPAPFHYLDAYYAGAMAQLSKIHSEESNRRAISVTDGILLARSCVSTGACHLTSFLVFRDKVLVKTQPYSAASEMHFDTGNVAGDYEVVVLSLNNDSTQPALPPLRQESKHRFRIGENANV